MPIFGGMIMTPRSLRGGRTSGGNLTETSRQNIQQSQSDPMNLRRVNTDDSSVFSGLASIHNENSGEDDENQVVRGGRFFQIEVNPPNEGRVIGPQSTCSKSSSTSKSTRKHLPKVLGIAESLSEDEEELEDFRTLAKSVGSELLSGRSILRSLRPVADWDSAFTDDNESSQRQQGGMTIDFSCNQDASALFNNDASTFCQNDASTVSYGSVNDFQRPRGKIRLLSNIQLLGSIDSSPSIHFDDDDSSDSLDSPPTPEGAEEISRILKDFGDELDENILSLTKDSTSDQGSSIWQDIAPRRVKSDDSQHDLSRCDSRELQLALQQAQSEVDILRDNNEQFISEIEQTEEQHESEMKLYDERIKTKMFELKEMYKEEIDVLIREKDAAIAEAGLQAARHAEAGRKQIAFLQNEIETLKVQTKQAVRKAVADVKKKKDEEWTSQLATVRASYESKLESWRRETERKLQSAVNDAVAMVTKNLMEERNGQRNSSVNEADVEALQVENAQLLQKHNALVLELESVKDNEAFLEALQVENAQLLQKQNALELELKSVKDHLNSNYSQQLDDFRGKLQQSVSPMLSDTQDMSNPETLLREVVESFGFLLGQAESNLNTLEQELSAARIKKERNEIYIQARNDLITKHRAELEYARNQVLETKEKVEHLEKEVKTITKENKALQQDLLRSEENHRQEVLRLEDNLVSFEKSQRRERSFHTARDRRRTRDTSAKNSTPTSGQNMDDHSTDNDTSFCATPAQSTSSGKSPRYSTVQPAGNIEPREDVKTLKNPTVIAQDPLKVTQEDKEESQRRERSFHSVRDRRRTREASGKNSAPTAGRIMDDRSTNSNTSFSAPPVQHTSSGKSPRSSTVQTTTVNVESRDDSEIKDPTDSEQGTSNVTQKEQEESQRRERSFHIVRERRRTRETCGKNSTATSGHKIDDRSTKKTSFGVPSLQSPLSRKSPPSLTVQTTTLNADSRDDVEKSNNHTDCARAALKVTKGEQEESPCRFDRCDGHNNTLEDHKEVNEQNGLQSIQTTETSNVDIEEANTSLRVPDRDWRSDEVKPLTISTVRRENGPIKTKMDALGIKDTGRQSPYATELARKKSFGLLFSKFHKANKLDSSMATTCQPPTGDTANGHTE